MNYLTIRIRGASMLLLLCFIIFVLLFVWFQIRWWQVKNYWAVRNVPHRQPHVIMGSLSFLQKENPAIWMREMMKDFNSPYVGIWLFWQPGLVINSPEIAKNILIKDSEVFRNRFASSGKSDPIGSLNIFTVNDPIWTLIRRRLTSIFTSAKLKMFQQIPARKSKNLVQRINNETDKGIEIDLRVTFADYSTDVIGETAFGMTSNSTLLEKSPLRDITKKLMKFNFMRGLAWSSIFFLPTVADIFGFSLFPKSTVKELTEIYQAMVQQRGGYDKQVTGTRDLFDALLKIKQEATKDGEDMHEDLLIAQAGIFLQGGFDTTASALTYTIYELAFEPHLQDKLYQELIEAQEISKDNILDAQTLNELPYLNAVMKETLRKYPILGWLDRVAHRNYKVDENLTISAGTVVYVNAVGMQSNPQYFPEPETYDPERFLPENEALIEPFTYMPFGIGPRHCIGERFASQSMRFAISEIVLNFEVRPIPGTRKPNECSIEKKGLLLSPDKKMSVQFIKRKY